jgi:membrane-bound lytic murein transglycosylase D
MLVKLGSTLLVPRNKDKVADVTMQVADNAQLSLTPEIVLNKTLVKAGKGETVATLARRYKINPNIVAEWNKTSVTGTFKPGQQVVLFLPARAKGKPGTSKPSVHTSPVAKKPSAQAAKVKPVKR